MRTACGFTLVDSLVSILIMSVGMLGLVKLQSQSLIATRIAEDRSKASFLANSLVATANADSNNANCYIIPVNGNCNSSVAASFRDNWITDVNRNFAQATALNATATLNGDGSYTVSVSWQPKNDTVHNYSVTGQVL
jgi:type IV pilus assembly protein PilV